MFTDQDIRNHFHNLGMPEGETDKIMNDPNLLNQTRQFSNQWGLESISKNPTFNGIGFSGGYRPSTECRAFSIA